MSQAYREGIAAGKQEDKTEFDNPYRPETSNHKDWERGFWKGRGNSDPVFS